MLNIYKDGILNLLYKYTKDTRETKLKSLIFRFRKNSMPWDHIPCLC